MRKKTFVQHQSDYDKQLLIATIGNDINLVRNALDNGADINARMVQQINDIGQGFTGLLIAANRDYEDIFQLLVEHGADPNLAVETKTDSTKRTITPLIEAAYNVSERVVDRLLSMDVDIHLKDSQGRTAFLAACENYAFEHISILRKLLDTGADINSADNQGYTPLMLVVMSAIGLNHDDRNLNDLIEWFIKCDANVFQTNEVGMSAIDIANKFNKFKLSDFMRVAFDEHRLSKEIHKNDEIDYLGF